MKKVLFIISFIFCCNYFNAQFGGQTCAQAQPSCGLNSAGTPNITSQPFGSPGLGGIDCLGSSPNAGWLYFQVGTSGNLNFSLHQGNNAPAYNNLDVDFVLWGPFDTLPNTTICGNATGEGSQLYDYPVGNTLIPNNVIACSFLIDSTENFSVTGAQAGKFYVLLVTNYSAAPGFIVLEQTNLGAAGAATTNCDIVCGIKLGPDTTSTYQDPPAINTIEVCNASVTSRQFCANFVNINTSFPGAPTYQWYLNGTLQPGLTTQCINATQSGLWEVRATKPGCVGSYSDSVNLFLSSPPITNSPPTQVGPQGDCNPTFDLTSLKSTILGTLNPTDYNVTFHTDPFDADLDINEIINPGNYSVSTDTTIYIRVESVAIQSCSDTGSSFLLDVRCGVPLQPVNDIVLCDDASNDGIETFDLTSIVPDLLGTLIPINYTISYHLTNADAANDVNPILGENAYNNVSSPQTIHVRVEQISDPTIIGISDFDIIVSQTPNVTSVVPDKTLVCNTTGESMNFSITASPNCILTYTVNGVSNTLNTDASGITTLNFTPIAASSNVIFTQIQTQGMPGCSTAINFPVTITRIDQPTVVMTFTNNRICLGSSTVLNFTGTPNATVNYFDGTNQTITLNAMGTFSVPINLPPSNYSYLLVNVIDATGTCTTIYNTNNLLEVINPTADIQILASNNTNDCIGSSDILTINGTPNTIVTYTDGTNIYSANIGNTGSVDVTTPPLNSTTVWELTSIQTTLTPICTTNLTGLPTSSVTSNIVPSPIITFTGGATICLGDTVSLNISAVNGANAIVNYSDGTTTNSLTLNASGQGVINNLSPSMTTTYTIVNVITDTNPSCTYTPPSITSETITVNTPPQNVTITGTTNVCPNGSALITFNGPANAVINYTINGTPASIFLNASGQNTINPLHTITTTYALVSVVTNTTPACTWPIANQQATVTVNPLATATITGTTTTCSGVGVNITFNGTPGATVVYSNGTNNNLTVVLDANGSFILPVTPTNTTTYTIIRTLNTNLNCPNPITGQSATVTVAPRPILSPIAPITICNGQTLNIPLNSNNPATTYSWTALVNNMGSSFLTSGTQANINQVVTLTNSIQLGNIELTITPLLSNCSGTPVTVYITVNPVPTVISALAENTSICSTNNVRVNITGNVPNTSYNWTPILNGTTLGQFGTITSGTAVNNSIIIQANTTALAVGTVQFIITPSFNGCDGIPFLSDIINVNPVPGKPDPITPSPQICSNESTNLTITTTPVITGTRLEWRVIESFNASGASDGTSTTYPAIIDQTLVATSSIQGFVRYEVTAWLDQCPGEKTEYIVYVNPLPIIESQDGHICVDQATGVAFVTLILDTQITDPNYTFQWALAGNPIAGATNSTYEATENGQYTVTVTNTTTGCINSATYNVIDRYPALDFDYTITDAFTENATIVVSVTQPGNGQLLYQLDNGGAVSNNVFENVQPGEHTITVTDQEGCTNIIKLVTVISQMKFFTPNGDGYNERWNIIGMTALNEGKVYIFDKYGKLIKQINPLGEGWDGTFNGEQLPSTDYWFKVEYQENGTNKEYKSHFTLKR